VELKKFLNYFESILIALPQRISLASVLTEFERIDQVLIFYFSLGKLFDCRGGKLVYSNHHQASSC
jgi:hypothetical protein